MGDAGTVLHWDGQAWRIVPGPGVQRLYAVATLSSQDVWVGGKGILAHWDGATWSTLPSDGDVHSIVMLSSTSGWAVGRAQYSDWDCHFGCRQYIGGFGVHWNGRTWITSFPTFDGIPSWGWAIDYHPTYSVSASSDTEVWVVGDSNVRHWNGRSWMFVSSAPGVIYNAVSQTMIGEVWAVGEKGGAGVLQRFNLASLPTPTPTP